MKMYSCLLLYTFLFCALTAPLAARNSPKVCNAQLFARIVRIAHPRVRNWSVLLERHLPGRSNIRFESVGCKVYTRRQSLLEKFQNIYDILRLLQEVLRSPRFGLQTTKRLLRHSLTGLVSHQCVTEKRYAVGSDGGRCQLNVALFARWLILWLRVHDIRSVPAVPIASELCSDWRFLGSCACAVLER